MTEVYLGFSILQVIAGVMKELNFFVPIIQLQYYQVIFILLLDIKDMLLFVVQIL